MTDTKTRYNATEYFDTARFTLRGIIPLVRNGLIFDEEAPTLGQFPDTGLNSWATRLSQSINETHIAWHIVCDEDGVADISRSVSFLTPQDRVINHTVLLKQIDLNEMPRHVLSATLCEVILGVPFIPMESRKEAKLWWDTAERDAAYIFGVGMDRILTHGVSSGFDWSTEEIGERWDEIQNAAQIATGQVLGEHKSVMRRAEVIAYSANVYDDAFYTKAYDLLTDIYPATAMSGVTA